MLPGEAGRKRRDPVLPLRQLALPFVVVAAVALAASGCGDSDDASSGDAFADGDSSLSVTLDTDGPGGEAEQSENVTCEDGSDDEVCQAVAEIDVDGLGPVPADMACTEIFGGPDTASLEGTIEGEEVDVDLTRGNGCEIERFDAAVPLLQALYPAYEPGGAIAP